MSNTLFIQFYVEFDGALTLCNGFSDTYDFCKNKGDLVWVDEKRMEEYEIPFNKGTVYVSAFFVQNIHQVFKWSIKYPNVNFIVGGPAVMTYPYEEVEKYSNVELTSKSVEEYFGIQNFSSEWGLDLNQIKNITEKHDIIMFVYSLDSNCYWNKCTFCNYNYENKDRKRNIIDISAINNIDFNGHKQVRINTPGLTPAFAKKLLDVIEYDEKTEYDFLMRSSKAEYTMLDELLSKKDSIPNLKVRLGVEFPSKKMLRFLKKGFTVDDILATMNVLSKYNVKIYSSYMMGWPNIEQSDIDELKVFATKVPHLSTISIFRTFCPINSELHETFKWYKGKDKRYVDDVYLGYSLDLEDGDLKMNMEAINIIKEMFPYDRLVIHSKLKDIVKNYKIKNSFGFDEFKRLDIENI